MFLEKKAALEAEGFEAHDLTISAVYANAMALVLALPIVLVLWAVLSGKMGMVPFPAPMLLGVLVLFFLLLVVHEAIHGLFWSFFRNKWEIHFLWHHVELFDTVLHLSGGIDKGTVCHWRVMPLCCWGFCRQLRLFWGKLAFVLAECPDDSSGWRRFDHSLEVISFSRF